jgi:hypothetical protein
VSSAQPAPAPAMDEYRKLIADVMAAAVKGAAAGPQVFDNLGPSHARAVIEAMLLAAREVVCIYAECLSTDVYDMDLIESFMSRNPGKPVKILVERGDVFTNRHSALFGRQQLLSPSFEVRVAGEKSSHIAIVDGQYARIEESQDERKALVSFGKNALCQRAQETFDLLWQIAQPIGGAEQAGVTA